MRAGHHVPQRGVDDRRRAVRASVAASIGLAAMARDEALRRELIRRAAQPAAPGNADRLWDVLDEYEAWPGFRLVDVDGERAAWLIAQLGDTELQRRCIEHLEVAVDAGDASPAHLACLVDRVRVADGQPQVYGSQWVLAADGVLTPWPIIDPDTVDARRARVGLQPLAAQRAAMELEYVRHGAPQWPVRSPHP
jgi:hypothetical protein